MISEGWNWEVSKRSIDAIHTRVAGSQHTSPPYPTLTVESLKDSEVRKPRLKWFSQSHQEVHLHTLLTEGRPSSFLDGRETHMSKNTDTAQAQLPRLLKTLLTWSESSVTRSPSLVIPSSFKSLRWGQRARQKALATCSVNRL